jgi:hypothetical protein
VISYDADSVLQVALNGDRKPAFPISIFYFGKMIPFCHFKHSEGGKWEGFDFPQLAPENLWKRFLFENPLFAHQIEGSERVKNKAYEQFISALSLDTHADVAGFKFSPLKREVLKSLLPDSSTKSDLDRALNSSTVVAFDDDGKAYGAACAILKKMCKATSILQLSRQRYDEKTEVRSKLNDLRSNLSLRIAQFINENSAEFSGLRSQTLFYDQLYGLFQSASRDLTRNSIAELENHLNTQGSDLKRYLPILDALKPGKARDGLMKVLGVQERRPDENQIIRSDEFAKLFVVPKDFNPKPIRRIRILGLENPIYLERGNVIRKGKTGYAEVPKKYGRYVFLALTAIVIAVLVRISNENASRTEQPPSSTRQSPKPDSHRANRIVVQPRTESVQPQDNVRQPPESAPSAVSQVTIRTIPSGAEVNIDGGRYRGISPFAVKLHKGDFAVRVTKKGYQEQTFKISVSEEMLGQFYSRNVELKSLIPSLTGVWYGSGNFAGGANLRFNITNQDADTFTGELEMFLPTGPTHNDISGKIDISTYMITIEERKTSMSGSGIFSGTLSRDKESLSGTWQNYSHTRTVSWSLNRQVPVR